MRMPTCSTARQPVIDALQPAEAERFVERHRVERGVQLESSQAGVATRIQHRLSEPPPTPRRQERGATYSERTTAARRSSCA